MISCIAIDDEPLALEVLKKYASRLPELNLLATFSDAVKAQQYLQENPVSLLFLDIQMPDINGLQLYGQLKIKPMVIFTTAYKEYALDGFEAEAVDYLLKPFNMARFEKAVAKAADQERIRERKNTHPDYLYVHAGYRVVKIIISEIIYIESQDDYVKINTSTNTYLTLMSMKAMMEKLPAGKFIRIHRSYIAAIDKIVFMQFRKVGLINNVELPVGDTYRVSVAAVKNK